MLKITDKSEGLHVAQRSCQCCCAIRPGVLIPEHTTARVVLGANHGHASGLTVPLVIILERPKQVVHTHTQHAR